MVALRDLLLADAIRMRLRAEPDIVVVGTVHRLTDAIEAARDRRVDALILGWALFEGTSGETLHELQRARGATRLILLSAPSSTSSRRWGAILRADGVVSPLEGPDRLLAVIRDSTH